MHGAPATVGRALRCLAVSGATTAWPAQWRAVALPVASAAALGILWVVQFVLMDRVIFHTRPEPTPVLASLTPEMQG